MRFVTLSDQRYSSAKRISNQGFHTRSASFHRMSREKRISTGVDQCYVYLLGRICQRAIFSIDPIKCHPHHLKQ